MRRPKATADPIEQAYLHGHPNPKRIDCPGSEVLRGLAAKELPISHPARMHITRCSPCFQEFRAFEKEIAERRRRVLLTRIIPVGAAAVFIVIAALGLMTSRGYFSGRSQHLQAAMLNFATSISRGVGSDQLAVQGVVQAYARRPLLVTMSLTPGSEDGSYDFQVVSPDGKTPLIQSQGKAKIVNGLTTITQKVDFSKLEPGLYIARVKHPPFGEWHEVPIRIE
jgi:hypothetical protein